jgi:hypothetical protein
MVGTHLISYSRFTANEKVMVPLQEYFLNRRTNPKDYPKYVGIRIVQVDARLYDNVLECCPRGCANIVAKEAVFEESAEKTSREPQQEGSNGITEYGSGEDNFGDVSVNNESALDSEPHSCDTGDVEKDEPFAEDSSESGGWIMGIGDSG